MGEISKIFKVTEISQPIFSNPSRQSIEATEDFSVKKVINSQEINSNSIKINGKSINLSKRVYSTTSLSTLIPEIDTYDIFHLTAQAEALTIANHSTSSPSDGDKIEIRLLDNATPRAITFGTNYVAKTGVALPTTTTASKNMIMGFEWNANLSKWNLLALGTEA